MINQETNMHSNLEVIKQTFPRLEGFLPASVSAPEVNPIDINKILELTSTFQDKQKEYGLVLSSYLSPQLKIVLLVLDSNGSWDFVKSFEINKNDAKQFKPDAIYKINNNN